MDDGNGLSDEHDGEGSEEDSSDSGEEEDDEDEDEGSGPEYDGAEAELSAAYVESGPNAPRIDVPAGVYDLPQHDEDDHDNTLDHDAKGKKRAIWHDPADDLVSVDLERDNRLKKLARGKKGSLVNGEELMKRLRKQYVVPHSSQALPRPSPRGGSLRLEP